MFALYLVLTMNGATCSAVAICDEAAPSCDAIVLECNGPVSLSACLHEASAYPLGAEPDYTTPWESWDEPLYGLGCAPDASVVVFDRDELEWAAR